VEDRLVSDGDKIRVAFCDDYDLFRSGLAEMLTTAEDIEVVGEAMSDGAAAVEVAATGEDSGIPKPVATQAYLAIRGAVRNAIQHSGCSRVGVSLEVTHGELCGVVEDDGEGFDPEGAERTMPSWGGGPEVDEEEGRDARRERACRVHARLRHEGGDWGPAERAPPERLAAGLKPVCEGSQPQAVNSLPSAKTDPLRLPS